MATVFDVAQHILKQKGELSTMRLHKLCYYSQAWHLVWDRKPLFHEEIQAWRTGAVIPELYKEHDGWFSITAADTPGSDHALKKGSRHNLTPTELDTIDVVLNGYGDFTGNQLSEINMRECPYCRARQDVDYMERDGKVIPHSDMKDYYTARYGKNRERNQK